MVIWSLVEPHGPAGSVPVKVSVAVPAAISAALGVYTAFNVVLFGEKLPPPPLQVPVVDPPDTLPASVTAGLLEQTVWSDPAVVTTWGLTTTVVLLLERDVLQFGEAV